MMNAQASLLLLAVACTVGYASGNSSPDAKFDMAALDLEHVDCKKTDVDVIDECGLRQGFSRRFEEFAYPTNFTQLMSACKRQSEAFKCLRAYSKCLPSLSRQVLNAMISSRQKYNKKLCNEKQSDTATQLMELSQCMSAHQETRDRGLEAELHSVSSPEAISNSKIESVQDRIKYSCCSVAEVRKNYLASAEPWCKAHLHAAAEMIDSYVSETVGIICPHLDNLGYDCNKLPKLTAQTTGNARFFIRPIINVIQTLA